ncbi:MAG: prepilin-type N-terminal cleavage/methylation domain-containing protein [Deltaproteobacteria bacterium]|nr:prepilin-type N-terminal cleavage/methylation domain-containing protein [Deltaproteobacteria bacterium]
MSGSWVPGFDRPRREKEAAGFTLFELLITLAILAVVFSMLYLTFHQSLAAMRAGEERGEVIQRGRMILERLAGEIQGSFLPAGENRSPTLRFGFLGQGQAEGKIYRDRLDFTTTSFPSSGGGELAEIGYFLDYVAGAKGFTLFRRQDEVDGDLRQGGVPLALCDRVRSLRFIYFDQEGKEEREWDSLEGARRNRLPLRVEIQLLLEDDRGAVQAFRTQVSLPLAGEKG